MDRKAVEFPVFALALLTAATVAEERTAERIPVLPAESYHYADVAPPAQYRAALQAMDNSPENNRMTDAGSTLGRVLFYDKQLSKNDTISCASCHLQARAFSDPHPTSRGFAGGHTKRNAMGIANLRYTVQRGIHPGFFWDERAPTLEAQVLMPIQDKVEMGMELPALERKVQGISYYPPLFQAAFGSAEVTSERIAQAVAQFMRSMLSFDSKFDRAAAASVGKDDYSHDFANFTAAENLGKSLFISGVAEVAEIGCARCHVPPTFGMPLAFNIGLDLEYVDRGLGARDVPSNDPFTANNNGKFKAPSLRNVALTAPYMHDGRFKTLERVIEHYSSGVHPHENVAIAIPEGVDPRGKTYGFRLTLTQKAALVAFLKTLTDETFIADPRFSDPFPAVNE